MLKEGVKGTQEIMVTEENTAKVMASEKDRQCCQDK